MAYVATPSFLLSPAFWDSLHTLLLVYLPISSVFWENLENPSLTLACAGAFSPG